MFYYLFQLNDTKLVLTAITDSHVSYTWDNWPHEEERSKCGYVGLTNLGATCYMATCMQHLYMIPQARRSVLEAKVSHLFHCHINELFITPWTVVAHR